MIDAEMRYSRDSPEFGRGLSNYGPEVLSYASPFERELEIRLKDVYEAPNIRKFLIEFSDRKLPSKPALGDYLFLLKSANRMSEELIAAIESKGLTAHRNPELLKQLGRLKDRRNPAAHGAENPPGRVVDIRSLVFSGGLLRDFLESLSPAH